MQNRLSYTLLFLVGASSSCSLDIASSRGSNHQVKEFRTCSSEKVWLSLRTGLERSRAQMGGSKSTVVGSQWHRGVEETRPQSSIIQVVRVAGRALRHNMRSEE